MSSAGYDDDDCFTGGFAVVRSDFRHHQATQKPAIAFSFTHTSIHACAFEPFALLSSSGNLASISIHTDLTTIQGGDCIKLLPS